MAQKRLLLAETLTFDEKTADTERQPIQREAIRLTHPRHNTDCWYLIDSENLFELQKLKDQDESSFFVDNCVLEDGSFHIASRVDPLYFLIPTMASNRKRSPSGSFCFSPLDQILMTPELIRLCELSQVVEQIEHICDFKDIGDGEKVYSLSDEKVMEWLRTKVDRVKSVLEERQFHAVDVDFSLLATQLIGEYISADLLDKLCEALGLEPKKVAGVKGKKRKLGDTNVSRPPKRQKAEETTGVEDMEVEAILMSQGTLGDDIGLGRVAVSKPVEIKKKPKLTVAQKKFSKLDGKGMKGLSSYFGVVKKSSKKE